MLPRRSERCRGWRQRHGGHREGAQGRRARGRRTRRDWTRLKARFEESVSERPSRAGAPADCAASCKPTAPTRRALVFAWRRWRREEVEVWDRGIVPSLWPCTLGKERMNSRTREMCDAVCGHGVRVNTFGVCFRDAPRCRGVSRVARGPPLARFSRPTRPRPRSLTPLSSAGRRGPRGGPAIHDFAAPSVRARAAARREALSEARDRLGCPP